MIFFHFLEWKDIDRIWNMGEEAGIFPADEMGRFQYYSKAVLNRARLETLPVQPIQSAFLMGPQNEKWQDLRAKLWPLRGFQPNNVNNIVTNENFFNAAHHGGYLNDFTASKTEDYYLRALLELAHARGFHLIYGILPVAESEFLGPTKAFRHQREDHIRALLGTDPSLSIIKPAGHLHRKLFYDFTHLNRAGARRFTQDIQPTMSELCQQPSSRGSDPPPATR